MTAAHSLLVTGGAGFIRRELGWQPEVGFDQGLAETVGWYAANRSWWEPLLERAPVNEDEAWTR